MSGGFLNGFHTYFGYETRYIKSLIAQTQKDYAELNKLWEKIDNEKIHEMEIDELLKKISWVKEGVKKIIEYRNKDIEGVLWAETERIIIDLETKEDQIMKIIRSVSNDT